MLWRNVLKCLGFVGALAIAGGCGDDTSGGTDTATGTDTPGGSDTTVSRPPEIVYCTPGEATASKSGVTCVETNVEVAPVTQDPACFANATPVSHTGLAYPWGGATIGNKTFTCNGCPNGLPVLQGRFRIHGFQPDSDRVDFSVPDPDTDMAWVVFVDGNTYYSAEHDIVRQMSSQSRGYLFCSMSAEHGPKHLFWQDLESSDPAKVGQWSRSDAILSQGAGNLLLIKFFNSATDLSVTTGYNWPFCKIGTTTDGQLCTDPFSR